MVGRMVGQADDFVQGFIRNQILGLPHDGSRLRAEASMRPVREMLGNVHRARPNADSARSHHVAPTAYEFTNDREGIAALIASRGLQAGGLTAAGMGLVAIMDQMGGAADYPEAGQLSLQ